MLRLAPFGRTCFKLAQRLSLFERLLGYRGGRTTRERLLVAYSCILSIYFKNSNTDMSSIEHVYPPTLSFLVRIQSLYKAPVDF